MSLRTGDRIRGYRLLRDFVGGANCRWTFAEADGREFFLKEFQRPKHPPEELSGPLRTARLARCAVFESRHMRLLGALRQAAVDGAVVAPEAFFRDGLAYYHVAPRVRPVDVSVAMVARRPRHERLGLIRSIARAVMALHRHGIVHGDLKPGNVLTESDVDGALVGRVIDFDGAFFAREAPEPDDFEFDQNYMAPEVLAYVQDSGPAPGLGADVFSLGLLVHEYWTGFRPSVGSPHHYAAEAVRAGDGLRLLSAELEPSLDRLIRRSLAADPAQRPTAWDVHAALGPAPMRALPSFPEVGTAHRLTPTTARPGFAEPPPPPLRPSAPAVVIRRSKNLARDEDG